jgi:poly(3-hydroxybutyrate) depolymerase
MTLIGGPIDTRKSPTRVNQLAQERGLDWFRRNCIVPVPHLGFGRDVYPGFLQLRGFMAMNIDRHVTAHWTMFQHLPRCEPVRNGSSSIQGRMVKP